MKIKFLKIKKTYASQKGFTLLETLVAVFILTLALTGPIYIATLAIRGSVESRDNISAYFLAEEAVEAARNIRDSNSLTDTDWLNGLGNCHVQVGVELKRTCTMSRESYGAYSFEECNGSCQPIIFDPQGSIVYGGRGGSESAIESKFTREIYLEDKVENQEVVMYVTIKWQDKGRDRQFQVIETLHNQEYGRYYRE